MEKKFVDFICSMHGYLIRTKEIHWNTDNNAEHRQKTPSLIAQQGSENQAHHLAEIFPHIFTSIIRRLWQNAGSSRPDR